jgi:hypothetical protein
VPDIRKTQVLALKCRCMLNLPSKLCILANRRHTVDRNAGDLLSLIKCFPNIDDLKISWSFPSPNIRIPHWLPGHLVGARNLSLRPTRNPLTELSQVRRLQIAFNPDYVTSRGISWAAHELGLILKHLPLSHVQHLHVIFEEIIDSKELQENIVQLGVTLGAMRFARLETIHISFNLNVCTLPPVDYWVRHR